MARARGRGKKRKALRYLILAGLTLLVAGFIARHEIPILIRESEHPGPLHGETDGRTAAQTASVGDASAVRSDPADGAAARATATRRDRSNQVPATENLSRSDRRRLTNLIGERAH